jgi:ABC-type oligopeptide transport system ATPase subunit
VTRRDFDSAEKFVTRVTLQLRGVRVSALVGPSGSGKSFRARLVADKRGFEAIVDDGLIVVNGSVFGGHWAKKEKTLMAATRRAIFAETEAALEARKTLRDASIRRILVVATSIRMARRICENLCLPRPSEIIPVDSIATRQEIDLALHRRARWRTHSSPAVDVRFRKDLVPRIVEIARRMVSSGPVPGRMRMSQRPAVGSITVSESALVQMVYHCVAESAPSIAVRRVTASEASGMIDLHVSLALPYKSVDSGDLQDLKDTILHSIERYTGLMVRRVDVLVDEVTTARGLDTSDSRGNQQT